jgi:hypothetical protein
MLAKVLYAGLQDPCHLGREGKNLINSPKFIPIYIIELHHNTSVYIHQAKLFVFLIQTKSLSIHMHVPSRSLVRQVHFPSLWFLWLPFTLYTHASSLQP